VNVIWHDYIAADDPVMPNWSFPPLFDQDFRDIAVRQDMSALVCTGRYEKDGRRQPNRIEPGEMLSHKEL
jgi:hypothetical protein